MANDNATTTATPPTSTTTPPAASSPSPPSSGPSASRVEGLLSDSKAPSGSPTPGTTPAEPTGTTPPGSTAPAPASTTTPTPPARYKYRGQEYTLEDLARSGLLADVITTAEQFPALQKKYVEHLEQFRQLQQPQPGQPAPQPIAQAKIRAHYAAQIPELVKNGYLESDFTELYPDVTSQMLYHRDALRDVMSIVEQLRQHVTGMTGRTQATDLKGQVDQALDGLAGSGDHFAPLKEPATRQAFWKFLEEIDPYVAQLQDPKFLSRQWVAFNSDAMLASAQAAAEAARNADEAARRRAVGAGTGARPTPAAPAPQTLLGALTDELIPAGRR